MINRFAVVVPESCVGWCGVVGCFLFDIRYLLAVFRDDWVVLSPFVEETILRGGDG